MKYFLGLVGILCILAGLGSCTFGGTAGLIGGIAAVAVGTGMFALGIIAIGFAAVLEEIQSLRKTLVEGLRHFARQDK